MTCFLPYSHEDSAFKERNPMRFQNGYSQQTDPGCFTLRVSDKFHPLNDVLILHGTWLPRYFN